MPITCKWFDKEQTIILNTYDGAWTLEEFHQSIEENRRLSKGITHRFVSIGDFRTSSTPPRNLISASSNVSRDWNPNYVGSILVRPGMLIEMLNKAMRAISSTKLSNSASIVADSLDDALEQATALLNSMTPDSSPHK